MSNIIKIVTIAVILGFAGYALWGPSEWGVVQSQKRFKKKDTFWQVQILDGEAPVIYLIQGLDPNVRVFRKGSPFHHPISLVPHGVRVVSDVALAEPLEGKGQIVFMGDKTQKRIFYFVLGKHRIRELPLHPDVPSAYKDFIAHLHPVPESLRHF